MSPSVQDLVTVSADCVNGQDIRASYELSYTSSSGASITTCVVDGTDCSDGVCYHELQDNVTDSRCQPPVSQFSNESVTVTVTAGNLVGRSNPAVYRSIGEFVATSKRLCDHNYEDLLESLYIGSVSNFTHLIIRY